MENKFLTVLLGCPWAQNVQLLKKPEQPETVQTVLNDMIKFNLREDCQADEIEPLVVGYLNILGFTDTKKSAHFESHSEGVKALFAGIFANGTQRVRIAVSWLEQDERLVVIQITQLD